MATFRLLSVRDEDDSTSVNAYQDDFTSIEDARAAAVEELENDEELPRVEILKLIAVVERKGIEMRLVTD